MKQIWEATHDGKGWFNLSKNGNNIGTTNKPQTVFDWLLQNKPDNTTAEEHILNNYPYDNMSENK